MHLPKSSYLLLLAGCTFTACDKVTCTEEGEAKLTGAWLWESTNGGIANNIHQTPASTGTSKELRLTSGGRYSFFANGNLMSEGSYTTSSKTCIHDHKNKTWIQFSDHPEQSRMVEHMVGNVIVLSDEAFDGVSDRYSRKAATNN